AIYREQGRSTQALPLLERALEIRQRTLGPDHRDVARALVDLALALVRTGQATQAEELATRALGIWERLDAPEAPDYAKLLQLCAEIRGTRGEYVAAKDYYERVLSIRRKVFGTTHPLYAETEAGLALALANIGISNVAFDEALEAEAIGRQHLRTT